MEAGTAGSEIHGHQIRRVGGFALLPRMGPVKWRKVENRSLSGTINWQRCVHIVA
ncbi:hypothetical protein J6590_004989 [Homalodisca vitripennis]|nr:hypothetical protein J6590_004989 [Homalodisca vitripennis]